MIREIKFRAWDRFNQKMISARALSKQHFDVYKSLTNPNGDLKFMQFTGLFDSLGKEIFEQDIVSYGEDKYLVGIEYGCASACFIGGDGCKPLYEICSFIKIVGNSYASKE
jgi:hypothetical protein